MTLLDVLGSLQPKSRFLVRLCGNTKCKWKYESVSVFLPIRKLELLHPRDEVRSQSRYRETEIGKDSKIVPSACVKSWGAGRGAHTEYSRETPKIIQFLELSLGSDVRVTTLC